MNSIQTSNPNSSQSPSTINKTQLPKFIKPRREFGSGWWCVVEKKAELVNSDHGAIVEREKLRLERDSVHRGWRERERDRDRESVEIILKSNDR